MTVTDVDDASPVMAGRSASNQDISDTPIEMDNMDEM